MSDLFNPDVEVEEEPQPAASLQQQGSPSLKIKIPRNPSQMTASIPLRRSSRHSAASGSVYQEGSDKSMQDEEHREDQDEEDEEEKPVMTKTRSGRAVPKATYVESSEGDDEFPVTKGKSKARSRRLASADDEDEDDNDERAPKGRLRSRARRDSFVATDEDDVPVQSGSYDARTRRSTRSNGRLSTIQNTRESKEDQTVARAARHQRRQKQEDDYVPRHTSPTSPDADGSYDEDAQGDTDVDDNDLAITMNDTRPEPEDDDDLPPKGEKGYSLRQRQRINYTIPPPLEDIPVMKKPARRTMGRKTRALGWSASGAQLGRAMGLRGDDSDSDLPTRTPRKPFGLGAFGGGGVAGGGGGLLAGDLAAGTPSNLGRVGDATLADADPLGVNVNVTFDEVGGLDDHINSLKEMTVLPLLYPEVFQQFKVTPPRGVLFHGPPGTGKTLLARALAASCRSNGKQISFFMRKGADALSKWVGEAERQLRLLFEEARNSQPSIIFFDEIDGLAPVRSSKQDQIHASIVSTLLALMDGMDGRGQVVVIGATNRPDAIDPALRRPGRFDREFYFPLPGLEAREKILSIMTRGWKGWSDEDPDDKDRLKGLAKLTKGYGGADLRALCTEATLNAVQRKYPQIYKSNDRLLLQPDLVRVGLRDFMISIKKMVPSSARSSSSAATPLPPQLVPLLSETLENAKQVISRVLPTEKKLTALEEAEFEDYDGEEGALEREMTLQSMEKLRVYRPRVILHGAPGMGQSYVGAAVLHHLEGYHVQSLELGTLLGDSTRTIETAIVQLFVEAKRHQPSVIYIPSLIGWCAAVSETARSTVRAMLDTLAPTDPILLLAIIDGQFLDLPKDVRGWFGLTKDNRVEIVAPSESKRSSFFEPLIEDVRRPPNQFADGMPRKKRVLEELPIAPPPEPRKPTAAELALQEEKDQQTIAILKYRLGPILTELKRKFRRFTKLAREEYSFALFEGDGPIEEAPLPTESVPNGAVDIMSVDQPLVNGVHFDPASALPLSSPVASRPKLHDMDLEKVHNELYRGRYLTPHFFLIDIQKIAHNAEIYEDLDPERHHRAQAMLNTAEVSLSDFDATFRLECQRMATRELQRREERRKAFEEEEGKRKPENGSGSDTGAAGARRSARNNGMAPEFTLTDPAKLERRLKRQREGGGLDSPASGDEAGSRDLKRSKMVLDTEDDPLNLTSSPPSEGNLRPGPPSSMRPSQPFIPPMGMMEPGPSSQPYNPVYSEYPQPSSTYSQPSSQYMQPNHAMFPQQREQSMDANYPMGPVQNHQHPSTYPRYPMQPNQSMQPMHSQPHPQMNPLHVQQNHGMYHNHQQSGYNTSYRTSHSPHPNMQPTYPEMQMPQQPFSPWDNFQHEQGMAVDQYHQTLPSSDFIPAQRNSGFDPALLNPVSEDTMNDDPPPQAATNPPVVQADPFLTAPVPHEPIRQSTPQAPSKPPSKSPEPARELTPMPVIARTPTPLPEFHVDESLLAQLQSSLRTSTSTLTIEQLEQLRATCLGCVWRSRKEWDRGALIRELQDLVNDFLAEVSADSVTSEDEMR